MTRVMVKAKDCDTWYVWATFMLERLAQEYAAQTKAKNPTWDVEIRYTYVTYDETNVSVG